MEEILYFTKNKLHSTCAKLYNMTMGDFLDNVSNGTTLGLELLASLTNYKYLLVPPTLS